MMGMSILRGNRKKRYVHEQALLAADWKLLEGLDLTAAQKSVVKVLKRGHGFVTSRDLFKSQGSLQRGVITAINKAIKTTNSNLCVSCKNLKDWDEGKTEIRLQHVSKV